jgi:hypothetical protein
MNQVSQAIQMQAYRGRRKKCIAKHITSENNDQARLLASIMCKLIAQDEAINKG